MGDSRIYFLSPTKGLQQLTKDDLESSKDAFQMIREDPPMSQYITADMPEKWQIHWKSEKFQESGCILACTDGCFQYIPAPWDFEKLLLETLTESKTASEWKELLIKEYEKIRQDDVSLVLYPVGYTEFDELKSNYQTRLANLRNSYNSPTDSHEDLMGLWDSYRSDYEAMLETPDSEEPAEDSEKKLDRDSSVTGGGDGKNLFNRFGNKWRNMVSEKGNLREEDDADKGKQIHELIKQAEEMERRGYIQETVKLCQQVLKLEPDHIRANFRLGQFYYEEGQYENAIGYCEQVVRPGNEEYKEQYSLALIYLIQEWEGKLIAKVIDFDSSLLEGESIAPDDLVGDPAYYSPEFGQHIATSGETPPPTKKSDIFSLGLIFCQYWTGKFPTLPSDAHYAYEALLKGDRLTIPIAASSGKVGSEGTGISSRLRFSSNFKKTAKSKTEPESMDTTISQLIEKMLVLDHSKRLSINDVQQSLKHLYRSGTLPKTEIEEPSPPIEFKKTESSGRLRIGKNLNRG